MLLLAAAALAADRISARDLADALAAEPDRYVVVDVRSDGEWAWRAGHIPQASHLAWPGVKERAAEIQAAPGQTVVLVCFTGHRSEWAKEAVRAATGAPVIDLRGGMIRWWLAGLPVVREPRGGPAGA